MVIDIKKLKKQLTALIKTDKGERKNTVIEENFMISVYVFIFQIFIMLKKIIQYVNNYIRSADNYFTNNSDKAYSTTSD